MIPCQGGNCLSREKCDNYVNGPGLLTEPPDRLCGQIEEPDPVRPVTLNPLMKSEVV